MTKHDCPTCSCETPADYAARRKRERDEIARKQRELEFVRRHSVLSDDDLEWARAQLEARAER